MGRAQEGFAAEVASLDVAHARLPVWTDWGVEDESVAVHSLGLTWLTTLGQALGFVACAEFPVAGGRVRVDSIWWDGASREARAAFEFEREKGRGELVEKVRNLRLAWHAAGGTMELLGLVYWSKSGLASPVEQGPLWRAMSEPLRDEHGARVPAAPTRALRVCECIHRSGPDGRVRLHSIQVRRRP